VKHLPLLFHKSDELRASVWIDVELGGDVIEILSELLERLIAIHFHQRRIGREIFALLGGLEDSFEGMLENAFVPVLGPTQGLVGLLAFENFVLKNAVEANGNDPGTWSFEALPARQLDFARK
jgi:hypothetical protein